jgi:LPS sulfotransferase NodH
LDDWFPDVRWLWLRRADRLAQAISWEIADQTRAYTSLVPAERAPMYSVAAITKRMARIEAEETAWQSFFDADAIEPLSIWYDDLTAEPAATVRSVADFIGEDLAPPKIEAQRPNPFSGMTRQRNEINADWQQRFLDETRSKRTVLRVLAKARRLRRSRDRL